MDETATQARFQNESQGVSFGTEFTENLVCLMDDGGRWEECFLFPTGSVS